MLSAVAGRIAPVVRVDVRERHVAGAEPVEVAEGVEGILDRVTAFDSDHDSRFAIFLGAANPFRVCAERELTRIARGFRLNEIDQPVREFRGAAVGVVRRNVSREKRRRDAALPQRPQIHLRLGIVLIEVEVAAEEAVGSVAVAIDDDRAPMDVITLRNRHRSVRSSSPAPRRHRREIRLSSATAGRTLPTIQQRSAERTGATRECRTEYRRP